MTKRIILLLMLVLFGWESQAQTTGGSGTSYWDPIQVTFSAGKSTFADVHDTSTGPPWYYTCRYIPRDGDTYKYTQGRAIFYRMETSAAGDVIIHNWNSYRMGFSTIFLLRPAKPDEMEDWSEGDLYFKRVAMFEEMDFMSPDFNPVELGMPEGSSLGLAYLRVRNLPAGTYYIVVAGYKYMNASVPNGQIGTTIIADLSPGIPGEPEVKPEEPNDCPAQYQYDQSGNRIKTIKKQQ